jgi:hypothetical protein
MLSPSNRDAPNFAIMLSMQLGEPLQSPQRIRHQDKTSDRAVTFMQIAEFHPASGI